MSTTVKDDCTYISCDSPGCGETIEFIGANHTPQEIEDFVLHNGWEARPGGFIACHEHASWRRGSFNLASFLTRKANYEGAQGYFQRQQRAWMNCVRCQLNEGKGAQDSWETCLDEYQKNGNSMDWAAAHVAEKVVRTAGANYDYSHLIKQYKAAGFTTAQAVAKALTPKTIKTEAKAKKKWNPNPWAVCTKTVGRKDAEKYERCVQDVKKKQ
jgi:hypothetical protein